MKNFGLLATALAAAVVVAGCGGSTAGDQSPRVAYGKVVNFGDSLSDVGSYATALVAANGEGYYSVNGDFTRAGLLHTNWTEYLADQLNVTLPCANEVGLTPPPAPAPLYFMAQTPADNDACFSYAQGGARVTNPVGPGNAYLYTLYGSASGLLGQLTKPVTSQIDTYLAVHATFDPNDLITVLAGGNDVFMNRGTVDGTVFAVLPLLAVDPDTANGLIGQAAADAVTAMATAGTELAALINTKIIANGAARVVVVNLPDVAGTPDHAIWEATVGVYVEPVHPHLTLDMVNAFNTALEAGLSVNAGTHMSSIAQVLYVDAFTSSDDQIVNPALYGLTNVTTPACDLGSATVPAKTGVTVPGAGFVPIATSLFCTKSSLITDAAHVTPLDENGVLNYQFADTVHPTPYGYRLLAQLVAEKMIFKGWL